MYIQRAIEETILSISRTFPVLLMTGPRQVGKTTLLKKLAGQERKYVTLDHPAVRELAVTEPELFLQRYAPPVMIDEIQYAPQLLPYIKIAADQNKKMGDYWLTGSQMFHVMRDVSESLAGRVGIVNLLGLSNNELSATGSSIFTTDPNRLMERLKSAKPLGLGAVFQRIFTGAMPRLYEEPNTDWEEFYASYVQTYIQRDIRDLTQVADELSFFRFLRIIAARTGTMVNYDSIANEAEISAPTAKQWLSLLISSGIVALIEPYHNNLLKRVVKAPRMYFLDTGLCAYLTQWNSAEALEAGAMSGTFFETWVVSEIYKSFLNEGKRPPLFYYRDSNKKEIDLIIYQNNTLYPIEIKKSAAPKDATRHFNALDVLAQSPSDANFDGVAALKTEVGYGAVVCLAVDLLPIDKKNWYVPAWLI